MAVKKTSKVKPENFLTIQGWMLTDLDLKGNALLIYAIIYGFSQDDEQSFSGSLQYLADWTNSNRQVVCRILKRLCDDGLLEKEETVINNVKFCNYSAVKKNNTVNKKATPVEEKATGGVDKKATPVDKKATGGVNKKTTNNIDIDNTVDNIAINNIVNNTSVKSPKKKSEDEKTHDSILKELNNAELENAFREFIKMRKAIKKPLTPYALELAIKDLFKLSNDVNEMIAIVNQSIANSWQGLFPLKKINNNNTYNNTYQNIQKSSNQFLELLNQGGF